MQACQSADVAAALVEELVADEERGLAVELNGAPRRSRATRSQAAWRDGRGRAVHLAPQGPVPVSALDEQTKPSAVSGVWSACLLQSASRTPEQSVSQCAGLRLVDVEAGAVRRSCRSPC